MGGDENGLPPLGKHISNCLKFEPVDLGPRRARQESTNQDVHQGGGQAARWRIPLKESQSFCATGLPRP